ncbi:hypothetical protein MRX96_008250 [Rhipicephalus microplus]
MRCSASLSLRTHPIAAELLLGSAARWPSRTFALLNSATCLLLRRAWPHSPRRGARVERGVGGSLAETDPDRAGRTAARRTGAAHQPRPAKFTTGGQIAGHNHKPTTVAVVLRCTAVTPRSARPLRRRRPSTGFRELL